MVKNEPKLGFNKAKEICNLCQKLKREISPEKNISEIDRIETQVVLCCISVVEKLVG